MKKERTGFIFLKTFNESIEDLEPQDRCIMYEAIINYGLYGDEPELNKGYLKSIWKLISSTIDITSKKYDASVENGKKGGRPKKPTNNLNETQEKPKQNPTETLKENKIELKENKIELKENNNYDEYMKSLEIDYDLDKIDFGKYNEL